MFALIVHDPEKGVSRQLALRAERVTIGSAAGQSLVLRRPGVAGAHCALEPIEGGFKLVDQETEHGTLVNGSYIAQKRLEPGDRIELGGCVLVFERLARRRSGPGPTPAGARATSAGATRPAPAAAPAEASVAATASGSPAEAERPPRSRRRGSGGGLVKTALYTVASVAVIAGLSSVLPMFGPDAGAKEIVDDKLALARLRIEAGEYEAATKLFRDVERTEDGKYAPRVEPERAELERRLLERSQLGDALQEVRTSVGAPLDERLRRAKRLRDEASAYPTLEGGAILLVAELEAERRRRTQGIETPVDELTRMSDTFLEAKNFAGAVGVWAALGESDLATDAEVLAAATAEVEAAAAAEADRLLERAGEIAEREDWLGALIVLGDSELSSFRGTEAFGRLDRKAMEYEARLGPRDRRPPLPGRGEVASGPERPAPGRTAAETPSRPAPERPAEPSRPSADVGSGEVGDAVAVGDALFSGGDLPGALSAYGAAMSSRLGFADRQVLTRRIERANRAQWFLDTLRNQVEEDPARAGSLAVTTRTGDRSGKIVGVDGGGFTLADGSSIAPGELSSTSVHALAKLAKLTSEDRLNYAYFCMIDGDDSRVDQLLLKVAEDAALKNSVDSAIAFTRGMTDVPEWGFFRHEGEWLTFRERELARNLEAVHASVAKLDKRDDATHAEGLTELKALVPVAREEIVKLLYERRRATLAELVEQPELAAVDRIFEKRKELDARREAALGKIFDSDWYFYPYSPPECPPDKATLYPKRQQEVDALVDEVREVWGNEFQEPSGGVNLSKRFETLLSRLRAEQQLLVVADPDDFREEEQLAVFKLLPAGSKVTIRNLAVDADERVRLDRDVQVLAHNATAKSIALAQEREQVWITNCYRRMMGRQAVAWNDKLIKAARGHSDWMSRSGKFSHFNDEDPALRSPGDRIRAQGYVAGGAGENIARSGGARAAHDAWLHSSGHHRNILFPSHRELGVGNVGAYWTQNFAGGAEYSGNLVEFGN
ncbi:MAG: CAP domain-containing protein [Planctomycetota bacterium JB042]